MSVKTKVFEGSPASQLVQLMQHHGYNKDVDIEVGTVTAAPPALRVQPDNMKIELEAEDLIVAQSLTKHKRKIKITTTAVTGTTANGGSPAHTHGINSLEITDGEIEFTDELQVGDRVILASINKGQTFVILDRMEVY